MKKDNLYFKLKCKCLINIYTIFSGRHSELRVTQHLLSMFQYKIELLRSFYLCSADKTNLDLGYDTQFIKFLICSCNI